MNCIMIMIIIIIIVLINYNIQPFHINEYCCCFFQALVPARLETRTATGLVKGHAYSVTAVDEVCGGSMKFR